MKRHIITAMCALTAFNATHAQHDYEQGNVAVEVQVNPFTTDFNTFRLGKDSGRDQFKLKGKYFINDKHAIRIGIGFSTNSKSHDLGDGFTTESNYIDSEYPNTTPSTEDAHQSTLSKEGTKKNKNGHFSVDLGYEYHFLKEDRVNLYAGAQIGLFKDYVSETYDYTETYKGWYNNNTSYNSWMSYTLIDNTKEEYKNRNSNGDVSCTGLSFN